MRWVVGFALLLACSDDAGRIGLTTIDAQRADAVVTGTVSVSIGRLRQGKYVLFQARDSRVLGEALTDRQGRASGPIEAGGFVTVVDPYGKKNGLAQARTFADVQPGDYLEMHEPNEVAFLTGPPYTSVTAPGSTDPAIIGYWLLTQPVMHVSNFGPGASLQANVEVPPDVTTADFLFLGYDTNNVVRTSLFAGDIAVGTAIDLSAYSQKDVVSHSVRYYDVPTKTAQLTETIATQRGPLYSSTKRVVVRQGAASTQMLQPVATGAFDDFAFQATTPAQTIRLVDRRSYSEQFVTKLSTRLVAEVTTCPTYDEQSRRLFWTESSQGVTPNFVLATVVNIDVEWSMVAPVDGTVVAFPEPYGLSKRSSYLFNKLERAYTPNGYSMLRDSAFWPYTDLLHDAGALGHVTSSEVSVAQCSAL